MDPESRFFPLLIAAGAVFIGAIFFIVGRRVRKEERDLTSGLASAQATILKKLRKPGAGTWAGLENYFILVRFTAPSGANVEVDIQVPSRAWRMLREGGTTGVNFPADRPEQAQFGSAFAYRFQRAVGALLMIGGIFAALFFAIFCVLDVVRGPQP